MSQPSQLSPERPGDAITYRPLSGLAIASLACGGLYALLVVVSALVAVVQGIPVFLSPWFLLLPAAGILLALLAHWRIRAAEGTVAGSAVARWGLWLSVLAGLGYGTYDAFTGIAVKQQANHFLMEMGAGSGFFPRLEKGDLNGAFLLTRVPTQRGNVNPEDSATMTRLFDEPQGNDMLGPLTQFRQSDIADAVRLAGEEGKGVEPLGVRDCTYAQKGYKVVRNYRVSNREVTMDIAVTVQSVESTEPGEGRKWFVVWTRKDTHPLSTSLTPLGMNLHKLRQSSVDFFRQWSLNLQRGDAAAAKDVPVPTLDEKVQAPATAPQSRGVIRDAIARLLRGQGAESWQPTFSVLGRAYGPWRRTPDGKVQIDETITLQMPAGVGQMQYTALGQATVESLAPIDPENFSGSAAWRVVELEFQRIRLSQRKGPGG